jgi:hypothetical protein
MSDKTLFFIEEIIMNLIKKMLSGPVNEVLEEAEGYWRGKTGRGVIAALEKARIGIILTHVTQEHHYPLC